MTNTREAALKPTVQKMNATENTLQLVINWSAPYALFQPSPATRIYYVLLMLESASPSAKLASSRPQQRHQNKAVLNWRMRIALAKSGSKAAVESLSSKARAQGAKDDHRIPAVDTRRGDQQRLTSASGRLKPHPIANTQPTIGAHGSTGQMTKLASGAVTSCATGEKKITSEKQELEH